MVPENTQRAAVNRWCQAVEHLRQGNMISGSQARRQQRVRTPHVMDASPAPGHRARPNPGPARDRPSTREHVAGIDR